MKLIFWLLIILLFKTSLTKGDKHELVEVIKDFLLTFPKHRISISALCWKKAEFLLLTKTLMANGFQTTPSKGNLSTYWPHEQQMFLIDTSCNKSNETLLLASKLNLLEYPFKWLLIENQLPPNLTMFVRSKIFVIKKQDEGYAIVSKFRLTKLTQNYLTNDIAYWKNKTFLYFNRLLDARNRSNLMQLQINISLVLLDPNTAKHLMDTKEKHKEASTKVNYPLALHIIEAVNGTPFVFMRNTWGYKGNNTHFIGMMGDMESKTAEICGTPTFYMDERIPYIDIIAATTHTKAKFVFRGPPLSYVKNIYVLPFNGGVWIACIAIVFTSPIIFYIITKWECLNKYPVTHNGLLRLQPVIKDLVQMQIGAVCQQGSEAEPVSKAGRIATIFLFISMLFLYTAYSANIVALIQATSDNIKTLEDLLHSRIDLGVEDIPYSRYLFTLEPGKIQREIYTQKVAPPGKPNSFMHLSAGVRKMQQGYFAFHTETTNVYKMVGDTFQEHEKCGLQEIEYFNKFEPYFAITKNTTYGELYKAAITKMKERGIAQRAFDRVYVKRPRCENQSGSFLSVSLIDCYAAFIIFLVGIGISTVVFVIEKLVHYLILKKGANRIDKFDASGESFHINFLN